MGKNTTPHSWTKCTLPVLLATLLSSYRASAYCTNPQECDDPALDLLQRRAVRKFGGDDDSEKLSALLNKMDELQQSNDDLRSEILTEHDEVTTLKSQLNQEVRPQSAKSSPGRAIPAWVTTRPHGLNLNYGAACEAKEPMSLFESASMINTSANSTHEQQAAAACDDADITIRTYAKGKVKSTCCPGKSLACAGCAEYDSDKDECTRCEIGFIKAGGKTAATCQMCTDLAWSDPDGLTCADYEEQGLCSDGEPDSSFSSPFYSSMADIKVHGASPLTACCICGGGIRSPTPFLYPTAGDLLPLGGEIAIHPKPRIATTYSSQDCPFHKEGLSLDGGTGTIQGVAKQTEPHQLTCAVTASDQHLHFSTPATVNLDFVYFAYKTRTLAFNKGKTFTPTVALQHTEYELRCTPALSWLYIDPTDGTLMVHSQAKELVPRAASCTVTAKYKDCSAREQAIEDAKQIALEGVITETAATESAATETAATEKEPESAGDLPALELGQEDPQAADTDAADADAADAGAGESDADAADADADAGAGETDADAADGNTEASETEDDLPPGEIKPNGTQMQSTVVSVINPAPDVAGRELSQADASKPELDLPECAEVLHTTDIVAVVPNEPKRLLLVHSRLPDKVVDTIDLTVNDQVPPYTLVGSLDKDERDAQDAPMAFHLDCGKGFAYSHVDGELLYKNKPVFGIDATGRFRGIPSKAILDGCKDGVALCKKEFSCSAYGILPFTKDVLVKSFNVRVVDDTCWVKMDPKHTHLQWMNDLGSAKSENDCRHLCYQAQSCSGFAFYAGRCRAVRNANGAASKEGIQAYKKVTGCYQKTVPVDAHSWCGLPQWPILSSRHSRSPKLGICQGRHDSA